MTNQTQTCKWTGISGSTYTYYVYPRDAKLKAAGGNYIYARINRQNQWEAVYIGQTSNLSERLQDHDKRKCVDYFGATHVHAHLQSNLTSRLSEETDLRNAYLSPCNAQSSLVGLR